MKMFITVLFLLVTPACGNLVAKLSMDSITGTITFSQSAPGQSVDIALALDQTVTGTYVLALHEYRVNYDLADRCGLDSVGSHIGSAQVTSGSGTLTVSGMDLSGPNSIEGRSVVFRGGQTTACGTIEADDEYITAYAQLPAALGGTVMFRQQEASADSNTMIYTYLQFVGTSNVSPLKWMIYDGTVKMDTMATTGVADRCGSNIGSLYNPTASSGANCSPQNQDNCAIGSLSSKHGDISFPNTLSGRNFFIDLKLPLSGTNSVIGKTLVFMDGNTAFACANIVQYLNTSAEAKFSNKGVSGSITFSQKSPLDIATIEVDFRYPANTISNYKITQWPTPQKMTESESVCDMDHIGDIFSPFVLSDNPQSQATPDEYPVGDLSGKFGPITGQTSFTQTYHDSNIQLFGQNSVVGRSVVIFNQNARYVCTTIRSSYELTTAIAKFTYPVIGYVILQQPKDMWYADTQIYVSLDYGTTMTPTMNHNWHVHENPTGNDTMTDENRCKSAGGHYNPYGVDLAGNYATQCNPSNPLRCEVGDLSKKHSQVNIRKATGNYKQQYFFTDTQLPLDGPLSVIGKSITIHEKNSGGPRIACTNIIEQKERVLKVDSWSAASGKSIPSGSIMFKQHCTDVWTCASKINVQLSSLADVKGYHVHVTPTTMDIADTDKCQGSDVGGHYNPLGGPATGPAMASGTNDQYEVGDISGKFGGLTSGSVSAEMMDMNLPLVSPLSIAGRSIVIHEQDGSRWACGNIKDTHGTLIQAKATFMGDYEGYVILSQNVYDDGSVSPTSILVDLKNKNGIVTSEHNWHVHEMRHTPGDCASAGGHYNPYKVDMSPNGYAECGMDNPLRCEMGDQSKKLGQYDIGSKKDLLTDVNLNLEGPISTAKRSIVFHAAGGGGPRIACANLVPYGSTTKMYEYSFPNIGSSDSFSLVLTKELEETVASAIAQDERNILVVPKLVGARCTTVDIYFLGPMKATLHEMFSDVAKSGNNMILGKFKQGGDCTSSAGFAQISTVMMMMSVLLAIFGRQH